MAARIDEIMAQREFHDEFIANTLPSGEIVGTQLMPIRRRDYLKHERDVWFRYLSNLMVGATITRGEHSTVVTSADDRILAGWDLKTNTGFINEYRKFTVSGERTKSRWLSP